MNDYGKINAVHLQRVAIVYIRQSSANQVEHNRESTARQYALADRAVALGWSRDRVTIIDQDLGLSGASATQRSGFAQLTAEVAMAHVGIVLGLEVSRLARNNADWYRLLDLCGMTDTLIGDGDGVYHPGLFNDRLVLGLKGTMSEAELHILRARLDGGIRNKAARGELRRGLPIGFVWGDEDGEVLFHPDPEVTIAIKSVFDRFGELGSARRVWLWFHTEGMKFPLRGNSLPEIIWTPPTYTAIHHVLTNPVYAGAYCYGKTRSERYVDEQGQIKQRIRHLPQSEWAVLIREHHKGYIDWAAYEANQARLDTNTRPRPHQGGGALREGAALLQGLATCGHCGRRCRTHYRGRNITPGYHCAGKDIVHGRGIYCLNIGGVQIDEAVTGAFLEALEPAGIQAALMAAQQLEANHDAVLSQLQMAVERSGYEVERAERRYRMVDPENRLVARGLETEWEQRLRDLDQARVELARRQKQRPTTLKPAERSALLTLGKDLKRVWFAVTTTTRDRKELLRALLEEVSIAVFREEYRAHLKLRWHGSHLTEIDVGLPRSRPASIRTDEETLSLLRRLAVHYPDAIIAGILNRQGRVSAYNLRFTADIVGNLRRQWKIPRYEPQAESPEGKLLNIKQAATILKIAPSTLHRWLNVGFIAGEQITPGAPWQIKMTDQLRKLFVEEAPAGYVVMQEATKLLGVSRQTVLQRVKRGELKAIHVCQGRRKGLRIGIIDNQPTLFSHTMNQGAL